MPRMLLQLSFSAFFLTLRFVAGQTGDHCKLGEILDDREPQQGFHRCIPCPRGADCMQLSDLDEKPLLSALQPLDGFISYSWAAPHSPFGMCPRSDACQNGTCTEGYESDESVAPLCSVCVSGYTLQSKRCVKCDTDYYAEKIAVGTTIFVTVIIMLTFRRKRISRAIKKHWKVLVPIVSIIKVQINFVQIGCSTGIMIPIAWPEIYLRWLQYLNFFQFDMIAILGLNCISELNSYEASFLATMLLLLVCSAVICSGYLCVSKAKREALSAAKKRRSSGEFGVFHGNSGMTKGDVAHAAGILFDTMDVDFGGSICAVELSAVIRYMQNYHYEGNGRTRSVHKRSLRKMRRTSVNANSTVLSKQFVVTTQFMISLGAVEDDKTKELHLDKPRFVKAIVDGKLSGDPPMLEWVYHIEQERLAHTYLSTIVQIFLIFHAPLSQKLFFYFNTLEIGGRSFMFADFSMEVGTDRYTRFIPVVVLVGIVFTLGLPFFILYVLVCKHRQELRTPTVLNRYGFLYLRYTHGSELWEVHEIFRKLLLCGIIVYLPGKNRAAGAILVCVLSCCSLNFFRPQRQGPVFVVAELAFVATTFKYVAAVIISTEQHDIDRTSVENSDIGMGVVVVVTDVMVMLSGFAAVCVLLSRGVSCGDSDKASTKVAHEEAGEHEMSIGFDGDYVMEQSFRRLPGVNTAGSDGPEREEGHSSSAMLSAMRAAAHVAGHSHAVAKKRLEERIVRANTLLT